MNPPSDLAGVPTDAEVPRIVAELPGGDRAEAVWRNQLGGVTFCLPAIGSMPARHAKWQPPPSRSGADLSCGGERQSESVDLRVEAERLSWASQFTAVPPVRDVVEVGREQVLVTDTIRGTSAVLAPWTERPAAAAWALGAGLRTFHDALPVEACPWTWSSRDRIARVRDVRTRERLASANPRIDRLVVCHGDACAPNTLLSDGVAAGHVDLGDLGVGDRWADLAVLAMSTVWNYGEGYEGEVYAGYGVDPDPARIAFFRDLWNAE